jgi:NADH:ubiquinone oxidoreductase subunit 4 (subunit M)
MSTTSFALAASSTFPVLPSLIIIPLIGALLITVTSRQRPELLKLIAVITLAFNRI